MNRQKALMKKYLSRPENHLCADCKRPSPTWASLNKGVFVCIKCSGCHREIGVHITKIKSVELDLWPSKSLTDFAKINNEIANAYWEYDLRNYDFQKIRDNEIRLIEFIRDKYEHKRWAKPNVPEPMNLVIQGRDLVKEFMNNGDAIKLYEKSQEPELEKRIKHFNNNKNVKKGRNFGIVDKIENSNNNNNDISNNNNNQEQQNINTNNENNQEEKKEFPFIKKRNNNIPNPNNTNNNGDVDLLGFGNEGLNEPTNLNINNLNTNNNNTNNNSGMNNILPLDIFSFGQENNNNANNNQNTNNINNNNENITNTNINTNNNIEENKKKPGFIFIKNKKKAPKQNNNIANTKNDINSLFEASNNKPLNNNQMNNNENSNVNNINTSNNKKTENINQNPNSNASNNIINLFENNQLVDLFNIETPTSDAVLNLSKNLINIYSTEKEEDKINKQINNNNQIPNNNPNTNSNYNVLNMNYPNININNYYPNSEQQQNKNKPMMNNANYGMNPMMGFNYPNQGGYMNNNFGFWYGYNMNNMNMNSNYMNMGMGMNNPMNTGFNYKNEFYNENKVEKDKEEQKSILLNNNLFDLNLGRDIKQEKEEQKPILLNNNNTFEINFKRDVIKEKEDPFKNLVNFN